MTALPSTERELVRELANAARSPGELAFELDTDVETVLERVSDLRDRGLVERQGFDTCRLTPAGQAYAEAGTIPIVAPFEAHTDRYEEWFEANRAAYESELAALRELLPTEASPRVEIGVGSGRFAAPLGVEVGVDPSPAMLERARERGVTVLQGVAESLPLRSDSVALALLVTTVCFVDDLDETLREVRRILRPDGAVLLGFVASESPLGRTYRERRDENPFYRNATFVRVPDLLAALSAAGFGEPTTVQTLFSAPDDLDGTDRIEAGWGEGSFVAVRAPVPAE